MNKLGFFAIIMILTVLPLAFAQDSEKIRQEYCQKNWRESPDMCSDFVIPTPELPTAEERNEALKLQQQIKGQALPQTKEQLALPQIKEPKNTPQTTSPSSSSPQNIDINQIMGIAIVIFAIVVIVIIIIIKRGASVYGNWNSPPSSKQVNYLSVLGYRGSRPNSSREASMIIDDLKHGGDGRLDRN